MFVIIITISKLMNANVTVREPLLEHITNHNLHAIAKFNRDIVAPTVVKETL